MTKKRLPVKGGDELRAEREQVSEKKEISPKRQEGFKEVLLTDGEDSPRTYNYQHVQIPHALLKSCPNANYIFVYAIIKKHLNARTGLCSPSYETIQKYTKLSNGPVADAISWLEQNNFIRVKKIPKRVAKGHANGAYNQYHFVPIRGKFERISYGELLFPFILPSHKAFIIATKHLTYKGDEMESYGFTSLEMAKQCAFSRNTINLRLRELVKKGYLKETEDGTRYKNDRFIEIVNRHYKTQYHPDNLVEE